MGFGFRVFGLARTFGLIVISVSASWLDELSQAIGFGGLFTLTLFLESLSQPRTTYFMNMLESVEEIVLATVLAIGMWATGLRFALGHCASRGYRTAVFHTRRALQPQCSGCLGGQRSSTRSGSTSFSACTPRPCCSSLWFT